MSRLLNETVSTSEDGDDVIIYSDSEILRNTFVVYGGAMMAIILLFCWARRRFPNVYNLRHWVEPIQSSLAENQHGFFSWMWKIYMVTDDEILQECGMDAACFIRIAQMGFKLWYVLYMPNDAPLQGSSIVDVDENPHVACRSCHAVRSAVGIFNAIWLMIVYKTSETNDDNKDITDGIVQVTIANVPSETPRLIATTLAAYVFFGYAMYLVLEDFEWFTEMRHKFLRQRRARNYAVFVRNIPEVYRSNGALEDFMRSSFSPDVVVEARVAVTTSQLAKVEANREATVAKLKHAMAELEISGKRPKHKAGLVGGVVGTGEAVDSIETYKNELMELNNEVENGLTEIERKIDSLSSIRDFGGLSQGIKSALSNDEAISMTSITDMEMGTSPEKSESQNEGPIVAMGGAFNSVGNLASNAVGGALGEVGNLASGAVKILTGAEDGIAHPSGFVVFSKLATTNAALQMVHNSKPFSMEVMEAPDPEDGKYNDLFGRFAL